MRITISSTGEFKNAINWLQKTSKKVPTTSLNAIGKQGVNALRGATPKGATGQTAGGWNYKIKRTGYGADVVWYNTAHPGESVNIAKIIQLGHGTGTGGYVPPIDYINPALSGVFSNAGDVIARELFK